MKAKVDSSIRTPEFLVLIKAFAYGFLGAEIWRLAYLLGTALVTSEIFQYQTNLIFGLATVFFCAFYLFKRGVFGELVKIGRSYRLDLLVLVIAGGYTTEIVEPYIGRLHSALKSANPNWALVVLIVSSVCFLSPFVQKYLPPKRVIRRPSSYFVADLEVEAEDADAMKVEREARSFAEAVLANNSDTGIVFGIDGPWGIGKTSFVNLAKTVWDQHSESVIVCKFEPLRYVSEIDLTARIIQELSASIKARVFAPEFTPVADRYSRLIKGKADISIFGIKLSLEPNQDSADDLLADIDEALQRINRRIIVIIDDLDRLDAKTINSLLYATRKIFKLKRATYILCYDTEVLVQKNEESEKARLFLEKFISLKISLFVDTSNVVSFLKHDWASQMQAQLLPAGELLKIGGILSEAANLLSGENAAKYVNLLGDMRKVKRFINALLITRICDSDLEKTDFNKSDLVNLVLLHLNYPGIFRNIYVQETEGRSGIFSIKKAAGKYEYHNHADFDKFKQKLDESALLLVEQLFDAKCLNFDQNSMPDRDRQVSRACFNLESARNLEKYLKYIVRFVAPLPEDTLIFYKRKLEMVERGERIQTVLQALAPESGDTTKVHAEFWDLFVSKSRAMRPEVIDDAIDSLIDHLPKYSALRSDFWGQRQSAIYTLVRLLDHAGWGNERDIRMNNSPESIIEIAHRIFGEERHDKSSIIDSMVVETRGVLGWSDLMLFRLNCCMDRQSQLHNVYTALIRHQSADAPTTGVVSELTVFEMREFSQRVFSIFKEAYIDEERNFFAAADSITLAEITGGSAQPMEEKISGKELAASLQIARSNARSFVIYQLSNCLRPNGSGIGCGYYDEAGTEDKGGISDVMNKYVFDFCFNPLLQENNIFFFLDHCLTHLSHPMFFSSRSGRYSPNKLEISGGLDAKLLGRYWGLHKQKVKSFMANHGERAVFTSNYKTVYKNEAEDLFVVLDELEKEAMRA